MSKIEEALRRARSSRAQGEEPPHDVVEARPPSDAQSRELVGLSAAEEIAHMREIERRPPVELMRRRIIHPEMQDARVNDAFRHLRTALLQKTAGKNFVLAVTSAAADGGASFVSLNLAASFAFDDSKTALLVDGNLRQPHFTDLLLDPEHDAGLTDYLSGAEREAENIIHPIGIPRLRLIPVGTQHRNSMEYFTTLQLERLLAELRHRYRERFVIIDTPPIMEAADARILAQLCDYALLVVPYGRVTGAQLSAAADTVGQEKLIGCVMNNQIRSPFE